jgi:uncharacterized protein YcbK (DUF882 family)
MSENIYLTKSFKRSELTCKCGCGTCDIDQEFMGILQDLRDKVQFPLIITSGFRCDRWNRAVKGANSSQHVKGKAADLDTSCLTADQRAELLKAIQRDERIKGVGIATTFIHIDTRESKARWVY